MNTQTNPLLLFSVFQSTKPESVNNSQHEMTHRVLQDLGYNFVPGVGVTKTWGKERMFLVVLPPRSSPEYEARVARLKGLMINNSQDAYLFVHEDRHTELLDLTDTPIAQLGKLREVSESKAKEYGDYTVIGDKYYSTI